MKESIRPLSDRIVVRRDDPTDKSPGGILLPDKAKDKPIRGTVVSVGPGAYDGESPTGTRPVGVNVGATVLFSVYSGTEIEVGGTDYLVLREDDILGVIEKAK